MIILKGYKSLVFYSSSVLIVTKKNTVYSYDIENKKITKLFSIPISIKDTILFSTNISIRILRLGVANATIYKNHLFFTYTKKIWIAKLDESEIIPQIIFEFENGKSPLNFSLVEENQSTYFNAGIYFGEYFSNPSESPVQIYHIHPNTFEVKPVFTFPEKTINHIHNLVFDDSERYFWVLAGDFGHCAGIWKAQNFFKDVECICNGKQAYRSCVGFTHQNDFLFATDSQFETNSIQLLKQENDKIFFEKKLKSMGHAYLELSIKVGTFLQQPPSHR
jgi:hypothetical protein